MEQGSSRAGGHTNDGSEAFLSLLWRMAVCSCSRVHHTLETQLAPHGSDCLQRTSPSASVSRW